MSTAPELFRARQLGIRCAGVSCITNSCLTPQPLTHDHVLAIARAASANLVTLLRKTISQL
jgi:purine-nucleoside phosphorylase